MTERRLGAAEVDAILRRASESGSSTNLPARHDPTVSELAEIAEEVGLDPRAVRRAAAVEVVPTGGAFSPLFGGPGRLTVRAQVAAAVPADRTALQRAAETTLGRSGRVVLDEEGAWVWEEDHTLGRTRITLRDGLQIEAERAGHYLASWLVGLGGWAALSATLPITLGPVASVMGFLATPLLIAHPIFRRQVRKTRDRLESLAMNLLRAIDETDPPVD